MNKNFGYYDRVALEPFVVKHLFPKEKYLKLSRKEQCLAKKIGHWFEFYVDVMSNFPPEYSHLTSQFLLIVTFSALEATIGTASFRRENPANLFYKFYKNNLTQEEIDQLIKPISGGKPYYTLRQLIDLLVNKRNDLIHRAELINLPRGELQGAMIRKSQHKGRKHGGFYISFPVEKFYEFTKAGIGRYMLKKKSQKCPPQDLRLWQNKRRTLI